MKKLNILVLFLLLAAISYSQQGIYLELGNLAADQPEGQPVLAYSHGISNSGTTHNGGGSGAGRANVQDLSVTLNSGKLSLKLLELSTTGAHMQQAKLKFYNSSKKLYYQITFYDLIVTSVSYGSSCGTISCPTPTENVSLNFARIKWEDFINGTSYEYDIAATAGY